MLGAASTPSVTFEIEEATEAACRLFSNFCNQQAGLNVTGADRQALCVISDKDYGAGEAIIGFAGGQSLCSAGTILSAGWPPCCARSRRLMAETWAGPLSPFLSWCGWRFCRLPFAWRATLMPSRRFWQSS